jgi:hypothetical protein
MKSVCLFGDFHSGVADDFFLLGHNAVEVVTFKSDSDISRESGFFLILNSQNVQAE